MPKASERSVMRSQTSFIEMVLALMTRDRPYTVVSWASFLLMSRIWWALWPQQKGELALLFGSLEVKLGLIKYWNP